MNRKSSLTTNKLPRLGAAAFACVSGVRGGLPFAQHLSMPSVRYQWIGGNEDQVQPGEGAA